MGVCGKTRSGRFADRSFASEVGQQQNWVSGMYSSACAAELGQHCVECGARMAEYFRTWLLTVVANSFKRQWTKPRSYVPGLYVYDMQQVTKSSPWAGLT